MNNYIQPGKVLTLTAPAGGVSSGDGVQIGQIFGVAAADAAAGDPFELQVEGVFELTRKAADAAWSEGDSIFWDSGNDEATNASAIGYLRIGVATAATGAADTVGDVRLDGVSRADEA